MLWLQKTDFRISPLVSFSNPKKEGPLMPQFLKFILYSLLPGFFINSYICVRFCAGILTPSRIFFSKNRIRFFLSFMIPITAAGMSKYWFPSMGSWLIQLTVLLLTILYFSDPLKKKISTFLILICILAVSENIAATFALPIYTLIHHEESFRYNLLYTSGEMLFLIIIDFFVALLFIKKLVPLIRNYSHKKWRRLYGKKKLSNGSQLNTVGIIPD